MEDVEKYLGRTLQFCWHARETVVKQTKMGRSIFRLNFVKPVTKEKRDQGKNEPDQDDEELANEQLDVNELDGTDLKPGCQDYTISANDSTIRAEQFARPRHVECKGLVESSTLIVRKREHMRGGLREFWVNTCPTIPRKTRKPCVRKADS